MTFVFDSCLSLLSPSLLPLSFLLSPWSSLFLPASPFAFLPPQFYSFLLISSPIYPYSLFLPSLLSRAYGLLNFPLFLILPSFPPAIHPILSLLPLSPSPFSYCALVFSLGPCLLFKFPPAPPSSMRPFLPL